MLTLDKGDFLATFSRNVPGDQILADTFRRHFINDEETKERFSFENFLMEHMDRELSNLSVIADHMNLLRSDHSQFWVVNNKEYFASLPAILLSDLGQCGVWGYQSMTLHYCDRSVPRLHETMLPQPV